jgi:hypothetical protein
MIPIPVAIWTAYNALVCISAGMKFQENRVGFALSLGTSALSCGLLSGGAHSQWLAMEITIWIFQMLLVILALAIRPPGTTNRDISLIANWASIRLVGATITWLCL